MLTSSQQYQALLDQSTPYVAYRWIGTGVCLVLFFLRIIFAQGWYIVAYALGIYLLNLFLAFLSPKFDPSNDAVDDEMEGGGAGTLPTKQDEEFKPFIRRLPEFKFWYWATRAIVIGFVCCWFEVFDVPVFWPVLVMYWIMLFIMTSKPIPSAPRPSHEAKLTRHLYSAQADSAHDQVPICPLHCRQEELLQEQLIKAVTAATWP